MNDETMPAISNVAEELARQEGKSPLLIALQGELKQLVDAKDFGAPSLLVIEKVARAGRKLLIAADPRVRINKVLLGDADLETQELSGDEGDGLPEQTPPNSAETYGATLTRELLPALQKMFKKNGDIEDILDQIKKARAEGMDEEVQILQDRLRGKRRRPSIDDHLEPNETDLDIPRPPVLPQPPEEEQP